MSRCHEVARVLAEEASSPVLVLDEQGRIELSNRAARAALDERRTAPGQPFAGCVSAADRDAAGRWLQSLGQGGPVRASFTLALGNSPRAEVRATSVHGDDGSFVVLALEGLGAGAFCTSGPRWSTDLSSCALAEGQPRRTLSRKELAEANKALVEATATHRGLTAREREVLRYLLQGQTLLEISKELGVSRNTVKFHERNLLQKLGVDSRVDIPRILF